MPNGPQKIILIRSGKYDYAEVELDGSLQIVGPNNTGKTTLINTLQFLYIDNLRQMDFGSYTPEQTRDYYFPNQYSYVLFECLSLQGKCVLGWRGQSKASGNDPERFCYLGLYEPADFFTAKNEVREPREVSARLALRQYQTIKSAQHHRELLLTGASAGGPGLGIASLRDNDKYPQFRETLKNLLSLTTITQDQMRDRLLMLADIPAEKVAIDANELFGDYEGIRERRGKLKRFKEKKAQVESLRDKFAERETTRSELIYRWTDLRAKRQAFETGNDEKLVKLRAGIVTEEERGRKLAAELSDRRADQGQFTEQRGGLKQQLEDLDRRGKDFANFVEDLERAAHSELKREVQRLELQLADAETESREKAQQKVSFYTDLVKQKEDTIRNFDQLAVTALRRKFSDPELDRLFSLLNFDLLEQPLGARGIEVKHEGAMLEMLNALLKRTTVTGYRDANVEIQFRPSLRSVADFADVNQVRERLRDEQETLERWRKMLEAIQQREAIQAKLKSKGAELEARAKDLFRFEEFQKAKANEPRWRAELKAVDASLAALVEKISTLEKQLAGAQKQKRELEGSVRKTEEDYGKVMNRFAECIFPEFSAKPLPAEAIPEDFDAAIGLFLRQQLRQDKLNGEVIGLLREVELQLGEEFTGADEYGTLRNLEGELDGLADKEEALTRDWNAHLHGLKGTFDQVLKELGEIKSAADQLNRQFARVQVSNLKAIRLDPIEHSDIVTWIRRLSEMEQPSLFDEETSLEPTLKNFRQKLENNPIIRYTNLFTLRFTVTGDDEVARHYQDFKQIESHGTTITIKVLFNLLVLKSQLRKDDCVVPFFLDEIQALDPANRHAILTTAKKLGFIAITAAPDSVTEVDTLYFLQPHKGRVILKHKHRLSVKVPR